MSTVEEREIETQVCCGRDAARRAAMDAVVRSQQALEQHDQFFNDPSHIQRVEKTEKIVTDFFGVRPNYRTHRGLGARSKHPFTVVKIENPAFPNHLSRAEKQSRFYQPLQDLGVEIVHSRTSNSWLFRIK